MKKQKLILENPLCPGDVLVSTCAVRDLHKAYPGEYLTDIRCPSGCEHIFFNSPYITKIEDSDKEARRIRLSYEGIHKSGRSGKPFVSAHTEDLAIAIGKPIEPTSLVPDIFLTQDEILWPSPLLKEHGFTSQYWLINAGIKSDYTLKWYHRYQEVVDLLKDKITFVQVGQLEHNHPPLKDVLDMRGKTDLRALFRLSYHAEGAICPVSLQMVVMAAFEKPCVVISGGREPVRWQIAPNHRFLAVNGSIECARYDGCWKSKKSECVNLVHKFEHGPALNGVPEANAQWGKTEDVPLCMEMIRPEDIARAVELYYIGKVLQYEKELVT